MNMESSTRHIVIVLGMHRSGTSAITRALTTLGVSLGDNLYPPGFDNPKGFWEDRECLAINEEILAHLGSAYDQLGIDKESIDIEQDLVLRDLSIRAQKYIMEMLTLHGSPWGFKDPRTCRLLWFWLPIIKRCTSRISFVIALRNPISVAQSLKVRNNMPVEKSYFLWFQHMLPAVLNTLEMNQVIVDYDKIMEEPYKQIERIAFQIGLPFSENNLLKEYEESFLDKELQHSKFSITDILNNASIPRDIAKTYELLLGVASDNVSIKNTQIISELNDLNNRLKLSAPLFSYVNSIENQCTKHLLLLTQRDGQIIELNQALTELDGQIAELNRELAEMYCQTTSLNQTVAERDGQLSDFNQAIAERDRQISDLNQAVVERDEQIKAILTSKSWSLTKPLRLLRRILTVKSYMYFQSWLSKSIRYMWRRLPLPVRHKMGLKNILFKSLPFLFCRTLVYRTWQSANFSTDRLSDNLSYKAVAKESEYVTLLKAQPLKNVPVKIICFYLPQFHSISENDMWWGEGFTEWSNVLPANPQFSGHYQPHLPEELGTYNLLNPAIQHRQIELAKLYGIGGFCFYFYWFGGKRLLETPVQNYLDDKSLDLPFCLCWANENWTRRWDGLDREILIAQKHSPEDDLAFIQHISQYMNDSRYIRIDGKPLLLVYRPGLLPSAKDTSDRWRTYCRENGIGEIYLAYTQSFEIVEPSKYGFDAAVEFPPNNSAPPNITKKVTPHSKDFKCTIYDWRVFVERSEKYLETKYNLFRGVCPSWDNTARKKNQSTVFLNSSPALYQHWLENATQDTLERQSNPDERLIFINAWNEWAEGAHLEPDQRYGYAWLQATRDALLKVMSMRKRIVIVSHDAHPHGAQLLALHMAEEFSQLGYSVDMILLDDGVLVPKFQKVATTYQIDLDHEPTEKVMKVLISLHANGAVVAIANTTVSGRLVPFLKRAGLTVVSLIHELPGILNSYQLQEHATAIAENADSIVFPASQVKEGFETFVGHSLKQAVIRPQGLYLRSPLRFGMDQQQIRIRVRNQLGLESDARIILAAGYADYRKGLDLFIDACLKVVSKDPKAVAIWVGHFDQMLMEQQLTKLINAGMRNRFIFPGRVDHPQEYFIAADVYALTSREDPFPSVVLEAYDAMTPVVAFEGCGGFVEFLRRDCGVLVPTFDIDIYAEEILKLIQDQNLAQRYAEKGRSIVEREFSFRHYLFDLLALAGKPLPRISVIVPNYNYEHYLAERLSTIERQSLPVYELIVLDDASTDDSVKVARSFLAKCNIPSMLIVNENNSGSVFRQWHRGIELARGDFVWIAEADDLVDPEFLESVVPAFQQSDVVISYSQSRQMAEDGSILCENYLGYVADIDKERWTRPYIINGQEEIKKALYLKNTIPNVSGVVFRNDALATVMKEHSEEIESYSFAGDWVLYLRLLEHGSIAFCPLSLNSHRRHVRSVTIGGFGQDQLREITKVQNDTIRRFSLDEEASSKAAAYVQKLSEQFGLGSYTRPSVLG